MALQLLQTTTGEERRRMSADEFLAWADEDTRAEWVDGEVIVFMPTTIRHLLLVGYLFNLLTNFVNVRRNATVFSERLDVATRGGRAWRQPDLVVLLNDHLDRLAATRLMGPADIIIEVISEESVVRDVEEKREDYAELGVPEYSIVEGREGQHSVSFLRLNAAGSYDPVNADDQGRLHSSVLEGCWLDPTWLAEDPLPDLDWALDQIVPGIHMERAERARQERLKRQVGEASHPPT